MAKGKRTGIIMAKRRQTGITMAKRKQTGNVKQESSLLLSMVVRNVFEKRQKGSRFLINFTPILIN